MDSEEPGPSNRNCLLKPRDIIMSYYNYDENTKKSTCKISGCNTTINGLYPTNLGKHIKRKHKAEAIIIAKKRKEYEEYKATVKIGNLTVPELTESQCNNHTEYVENQRKYVIDACIELVTANGRPLSIVEDSGLKMLIEPWIQFLKSEGVHLSINRTMLAEEIQKAAEDIRSDIRKIVRSRLISLKVDIISKLGQSILAVNIQYIYDDQILQRNLCVKEILKPLSISYLENMLEEILNEYQITREMLYSITTDCAVNKLSISRTANNAFQAYDDINDDVNEDIDNSEESDLIEICDNLECDNNNQWLEEIISEIPNIYSEVISSRCVTHIFQLAISDALNTEEALPTLSAARKCCENLRDPENSSILTSIGYNIPCLDCPTRWESTLEMINSLIQLRAVQNRIVEENLLSDSEWNGLDLIALSLSPAKVASEKCKTKQLVAGEFLEIWLRCKLDMQNIACNVALNIYESMEKWEEYLFNNETMLNAIYLDPRWNVILTEAQQDKAETQLINLWCRLENLKLNDNKQACNDSKLENAEDIDKIESFLMKKEFDTYKKNSKKHLVKYKLGEFSKIGRIPRTENIITFWKNRGTYDPELYQLAMIVLAVPVTQISVQLLISHLKFILDYSKGRLRSSVIEDIRLLRCNHILDKK